MGVHFDGTVHLSDLVLFATMLVGLIKFFIDQREFNRDVRRELGRRGNRWSRFGLHGDVQTLQEKVEDR